MHMCGKRCKVTRETNRRAVRRGQTRRSPAGPAPHAPARPTGPSHAFSQRPEALGRECAPGGDTNGTKRILAEGFGVSTSRVTPNRATIGRRLGYNLIRVGAEGFGVYTRTRDRSALLGRMFSAQAQGLQGMLGAHACRGERFFRGCAQSYSAAGPDSRPVGRTRTAPEMRCSQRACNALGQERKHHSRAACQAITLGCRRWLRGRSPLRLVPAPGQRQPGSPSGSRLSFTRVSFRTDSGTAQPAQPVLQDGLWYSSTGSTGPISGRTLVMLNRLPIMM